MAFTKISGDSETALSKLNRIGIVLSDQQKQTYNDILTTNGEIAAQDYLIEQLGQKYKGAAEAAANPFERLDVIFGNLKETIGAALLPAFEQVVPQFQTFIENMVASPEFQEFMDNIAASLDDMVESLPTVVENLGNFSRDIMPVINAMGPLFMQIFGFVADAMFGISQTDAATPTNDFASSMENLAKALNAVSTAIKNIRQVYASLPDWVKWLLSPSMSGISLKNLKMPSGATVGESWSWFFGGGWASGKPYPGQAEGGT